MSRNLKRICCMLFIASQFVAFNAISEVWTNFEGNFHQNSSAANINVGAGCVVKWDRRIVPGWDLAGGTVRAGTFNGDASGSFYSRNLSAYYGYLGLVGSTYDTYTVGAGKYCHAVFLDMKTGTIKNCISTNQWWGTKWEGADALETSEGEQVVAWDPDTANFHMQVGGDQCSHRSYKPLANMAGFVSPTPLTGVSAWEQMASSPGLGSSRGVVTCGIPESVQQETRGISMGYGDTARFLGLDEWDASTAGTSNYAANRSSYMEVQPGSDYLTTTNEGGHNAASGIQIANKHTGVCAHRVDQSNMVYDLAASPISAGGTPMFKRYGSTIHQGSRIYYMGPWNTDAASTNQQTQVGLRLACIQYGNQDLQANGGYTGNGYKETAVPTSLVFDYKFNTTAGKSWMEEDTYFNNLTWLAQGDGVWAVWKSANNGNFQLVRATGSSSSTYELSIGSEFVIAYATAFPWDHHLPFNQDFAYSASANRLALYTKSNDDSTATGNFYLTVFDCSTGAERWTYNLASHFTVPRDTEMAAIDFSRMTVAGDYAIVSWVDNSGTYATLKAVSIDISSNSAPSSAPAVFTYVMDGSTPAAVPTASYAKTRVRDLVPLDGVVYALIHETNLANGQASSRNSYIAAQRVVAIAPSTRSAMTFNWSVSPSTGAGKVVALGDASACSSTDAGGITAYEWDFDYDHITFNADASGELVNHTFSTLGTYTVALRLTDATHSEIMVTSVSVTAASSGTLTYENGAGIEDTFAQKSSSTWRPATNVEFQIHGASLGNESCAILKFDVSSIPSGSTIDSAVMQIYTFNKAGSGTFSIGTFPSDALTVSGACWDYRNIANNAWSASTPIASASSFGTAAQPGTIGWISFDVQAPVQSWVNSTATNNGLGIWASSTVDDRFHSVNNTTNAALSPKITINYSGAAPTEKIYAVHPGSVAAETYPSSSPLPINWGSEGPIDNVDLYYSTTASTGPWTSIAAGETNDGAYSWNASALAGSATVWLRITKAGDTSKNSVSTNSFAVSAPLAYPVSGTVTVSGDSSSSNGVTIKLKDGTTLIDSQILDATGNYSLDATDGTYSYELSGPGFGYAVTLPSPNTVTVSGSAITQNVSATATMETGSRISGTVTGTGNSGVTVTLGGDADATGTTDASGFYEFTNLADGDYVVIPSKDSKVFSPSFIELTIAGTNSTGNDFTISDSASNWSWDGNSWADPRAYLSTINSAVKTNLRSIYTTGVSNGRVAGRMGQIGDSITNSQAYLASTLGGGTSTNETGHNFDPIMGWICPALSENGHNYPVAPNWNMWYRNAFADPYGTVDDWHKGAIWCNVSGWKVSDAVAAGHPATVVTNMNPSWALIMYGSNDEDNWGAGSLQADSQTWKTSYKTFIQGFIDRGVIPVLSTIPPEHVYAPDGGTGDERYKITNARITEIASEMNIPYVDYYGWVTAKQPGNAWDGQYHAENRLISTDGVHPSNTTVDFSQTALTFNGGYRARTFLTLAMAEKIKNYIFDDNPAETSLITISTDSPLPEADKDASYSQALAAENYTGTLTWTEIGDNLPGGISLSGDGVISGTANEAGTFNVTVKVTDEQPASAIKIFELTVNNIQTTTLSSTLDTYISSVTAPTADYSAATSLQVLGRNWDELPTNADTRGALFKFDLSGIPSGSTIRSAKFRLYCTSETPGAGGTVTLRHINDAWTSPACYNTNGATQWKNLGTINQNSSIDAFTSAFLSVANYPSTHPSYRGAQDDWANRYVEFTITTAVSQWVAGTKTNNGFALCTTGYFTGYLYGWFQINFNSAEASSNKPELVVTYQPSAPETHTVTFSAGAGGSLAGQTSQTVSDGEDCSAISAVPNPGFRFVNWTGDYSGTQNPLTVTNVTSDMDITANFARVAPEDFDGDSKSDVICESPLENGFIYFMNGQSVTSYSGVYDKTDKNWTVAKFADFNGDGKTDMLWEHEISGQVLVYLMNGASITAVKSIYKGGEWKVEDCADFNGDGKDDILWTHLQSGSSAIYLMNGVNVSSVSTLHCGIGWLVRKVADFNGDAKADILWEINNVQGHLCLMNGATVSSEGMIYSKSPAWILKLFGDFNGDSKTDILWESADGKTGYMYLMNGTSMLPASGYSYVKSDLGWKIVNGADYNGDTKTDILWEHEVSASGMIHIMNGVTSSANGIVYTLKDPNPATKWNVVKTLDFNADGKSDMLWENAATKKTLVYVMDGLAISSSGTVYSNGTGWKLVK